MPQVRPFQQSLFPELSGTFQGSESFTTLNQEAKHDSQQRIQHHSRQSRLHFGVDETPGLPEPARQGGDELLPKPPEGSGRSGIGGDDSIHTSGTGGPGLGERNRLAEILTEEEIDAVKETSLNTHYTAIEVVDQMWAAANRLGFAGGRILEPGMGVGNFFARIPDQLPP